MVTSPQSDFPVALANPTLDLPTKTPIAQPLAMKPEMKASLAFDDNLSAARQSRFSVPASAGIDRKFAAAMTELKWRAEEARRYSSPFSGQSRSVNENE